LLQLPVDLPQCGCDDVHGRAELIEQLARSRRAQPLRADLRAQQPDLPCGILHTLRSILDRLERLLFAERIDPPGFGLIAERVLCHSSSPSLEFSGPLLEERAHAFLTVRTAERGDEQLTLECEPRTQRGLERRAHRILRKPERER